MQERFELTKEEKVSQLADFLDDMPDKPSAEMAKRLYDHLDAITQVPEDEVDMLISFFEARSVLAIEEDIQEDVVPWMEDVKQVSHLEIQGAAIEMVKILHIAMSHISQLPQEEVESLMDELINDHEIDLSDELEERFDQTQTSSGLSKYRNPEPEEEIEEEEEEDDYDIIGPGTEFSFGED